MKKINPVPNNRSITTSWSQLVQRFPNLAGLREPPSSAQTKVPPSSTEEAATALQLPAQSRSRLPMGKCLQSAKMLVPKFACQENSGWHIQWPKDDPHVVYAATQADLIPALAAWLRQLGRLGNDGQHVDAENSCPTCK